MPNKIIYTNTQLRGDLQEILRQMTLDAFMPDFIVGIARGGLVPATMLSHYLGKPLMVVNYSLRDNMTSHDGDISGLRALFKDDQKVLLVDDICDSGETLAKIYEEIDIGRAFSVKLDGWQEKIRTAVLWNNISQDVFEADYAGREINRSEDDSWVIFPYEEWWKA